MGMRGFSVALVLGDLGGTSTPDNLPAGAKKALSDMRDFLPYKSYRLLDTHWVLCCSSSASATVAGRLRGVEEEEYAFNIDVRPASDWTELAVRFNLRDSAAHYADALTAVASGESERRQVEVKRQRLAELKRQREDLEKREAAARERVGDKHPDVVALHAQMEAIQHQLAEGETERAARALTRVGAARQILDSTFSMKVGETVVIGTSRLKGDKALIALLTAASKSTPATAR
jgi:hypothetical protein